MTAHRATYCPRLWNEVFIDRTGRVFTCCLWKPSSLGSIHEAPLRDIINSAPIRGFRERSLKGLLECYGGCRLLDKEGIRPEGKGSSIGYHELRRIKILFAETCNIHCIMCWQDGTNRDCLDYDALVRNVDLEPFERIEIQGGEPLCIEAARRYFDYCVSRGKRVSLLTNGLLVSDEWAEKFALHSDFVLFSLNAATKRTHEYVNRGSKWETVLRNIQRVRAARQRLGTDLRIVGHMTIVEQNLAEIPQFIENAAGVGFDDISIGYVEHIPRYLRAHPIKRLLLAARVRRALSRPRQLPFVTPQAFDLLRLR